LPLYPDDPNTIFREEFFTKSANSLEKLIPEYQRFSEVVRVIDVSQAENGQSLTVLMNAEQEKALAILTYA
jgi:hypothetical protein